MQRHPEKLQNDSPFFSLLADADEVHIREVDSGAPERMVSSLERTLKDFDHEKESKGLRTFFVHIKTPAPKPAPPAQVEPLPYDAPQLQRSAELLLENQDYLLARNLYSYLLQKNLKDPVALRGLGICLFRLGEAVSSRKCFRAWAEIHESEEAHFWLALGYQTEGKDTIAAMHFEKVSAPEKLRADDRFDFFKNFGNCLTRLGQLDRAQVLYVRALEIAPASDTIHVNLGTLLIQRRDWNGAKERFNRALEINPNSSRAHCGLGLVALAVGNPTEAKSRMQQSLDLDSQNLVALHQLVELSRQDSDLGPLKQRLRSYLEREPNHADTHCAMASILFREGSWKACELHVRRALECQPGHEAALRLQSDLNSLVRGQSAVGKETKGERT